MAYHKVSPSYHNVVYGNYKKSTYPKQLAWKLIWDYMRDADRCNVPPRSSILDVGCGTGEFVQLFSDFGFEAHGIDANVNYGYYEGREYENSKKIKFPIDFNKDRLPYKTNAFDYVFTKSTIEHIQNTEHFLSEIYRVLKPKGKLIVLTPDWETNYKWFYDDPTHVKPFYRKGLQDAMKLVGFKSVSVKKFYHLPFVWKHPFIGKLIVSLLNLLPDDWRWYDWEQQKMNVLIRFSKEVQLLGVATK